MPGVHIVTDSTADLPAGLVKAEGLDMTTFPLRVHVGAETFRDKVDITNEQFLARLTQSSALPTTSQPPAGDFEEVYRRLAADGGEILSIHISSKLSGTYQSAVLAAQNVTGTTIRVVDSLTASLALGLLAITAARLARDGADLATITSHVEGMIPRLHLVLTLDTLEFLQRGGRIGRAQAMLGSLLNVKPILKVENGVVEPVRRERTRARAVDALVSLAADLGPITHLGVIHIATPDEAAALAERMARAVRPPLEPASVLLTQVGPVVATHVGPRGLGFAACTEPA